jgi:hypothetical protein
MPCSVYITVSPPHLRRIVEPSKEVVERSDKVLNAIAEGGGEWGEAADVGKQDGHVIVRLNERLTGNDCHSPHAALLT